MRRSRSIVGPALCAWVALVPVEPVGAGHTPPERVENEPVLAWTPLEELDMGGKGWSEGVGPFERLPSTALETLDPLASESARLPVGLVVGFRTDAPALRLRWRPLTPEPSVLAPLGAQGRAAHGFDLYLRNDKRRWIHVGSAQPTTEATDQERVLFEGLEPTAREFRLYLPIGWGLESAALGTPAGAALESTDARPPESSGPVVFYGGPDLAGAGASRPGRTLTAVVGRRIERDVVNLGLVAQDLLSLELGALLAEINASVFVFDLMDEVSAAALDSDLERFLRGIGAARPRASLVLVDRPTPPAAELDPGLAADYAQRQRIQRSVVDRLAADGVPGLHHLSYDELTPASREWTLDGILRGDLGVEYAAEVLVRSLEPLSSTWSERRP